MHSHDLSAWTHSHAFDAGNRAAERGTRLVMAITAATMVVEIAAGLGSTRWRCSPMAGT